jgi:molybdopterin-guanine dinucleotide biosynthesis adapter protein
MPRVIEVVGGKHSGKTTVVEHLIAEFKRRNLHVGTIKEMVRIPTLDTPATETDRYTNAGSEINVAVPRDETVVFIKKRLSVKEIMPYLKGLDYVVLEGFEDEKMLPKVIAAKTANEAQSYLDGSAIAISGIIANSKTETQKATCLKIPVINSASDVKALADLVEKNALEF